MIEVLTLLLFARMGKIRLIGSVVFVMLLTSLHAQNPVMDKLEMWYAQGHYKKVLRKANSLLDNPEYDYSLLPKYYKALSQLQLAQNSLWLKRRPEVLDDVKKTFVYLKSAPDHDLLYNSHSKELGQLNREMISWASDLKRMGDEAHFSEVQELISLLFAGMEFKEQDDVMPLIESPGSDRISDHRELRESVIKLATSQQGVPYQWAGSSPAGFDCSGFVTYVFENNGKKLPRRATDQFAESKKLKERQVQPGDLIFFDNGSGISHVGILLSGPGEDLVMIHSSSSKGIILTNVSQSDYWSKRLAGFGTFIY